jgi:Ca-activated chloride channel homolog
MSFLNPAGLFLFLFIPLIIFLHLFRAARREVSVGMLRFWNRDTKEHSPVARITRKVLLDPSLLLQLLAVLLLSLAVAEPFVTLTGQGWPRTVLIVDNSASLAATDVPGGRFAALRTKAEEFVAQLKSGQEAMILEAGTHPSVRVPFTADKRKLFQALQEIQVVAAAAKVNEAIELAVRLAREGPPADIHLFTDAAYPPPSLPARGPPLVWHTVGGTPNNVGITAFEVRNDPSNGTDYQAFVTLVNFGTAAKRLALSVLIDENVIYQESVDLPPKLRRSYVIPFRHEGRGVVRAQIEPDDDFVLDDVVYSVIPDSRRRKVLLVSQGNFYLESALLANPQLEVELISPDKLSLSSAKADVIVLDRVSPPAIPPGNYLLIQSLPKNVPLARTATVDFPAVVDWDSEHPVSRYLDFSSVVIKRAMGVRPEGDCTELVEAEQTPLVVACTGGGSRIVFVGFDILQSEIPLRATLPILLANAVNWLSPASLEDSPQHLRAGDRFRADIDRQVSVARIKRPNGQIDTVPVRDGRLTYGGTQLSGLYLVDGSAQQHFAVNLLDEAESDLMPGRAAQVNETPSPIEPSTYTYRRELWSVLGAVALITLLTEIGYVLYVGQTPPSPASLTLRGIALIALGIALAKPTLGVSSNSTSVAFLVDVSDSMTPVQKRRALEIVRTAMRAKGAHDKIEVITFAGDAGLIDLADSNAAERQLLSPNRDGGSTDIAGAIRLALATLPREGTRRIAVISDGNENRNEGTEAAWQARQAQVQIDTIPVSDPRREEVLIEKLVLPIEVHRGEAFGVNVIIWSGGSSKAELTLRRDGELIASTEVSLKEGKSAFTYRDSSEKEGVHLYQATITSRRDGVKENNTANAGVTVRGQPPVLYVDSELDRGQNLIDALEKQHFSVDAIPPSDFRSVLSNLGKYDAVILSNVSASSLSDAGMDKIHSYVTQEGGGLIMLGGEKSFGLGGYAGTPIEALMPVHMAPRAKVEVPSQAIVFVIDRSGSMSTEQGQYSRLDLAKQAAQQSIKMLSEKTLVGVLAFDTEADWIIPLQPAKDKQAMARDISTTETGGGGTELLSALEEAYRALSGQKAMLKHIVVLSDGEAPAKNFKELLAKVTQDKITVSAIAISSEAGQDLLQKIAQWGGGRYYFTNDLYQIPRILTTETRLASNRGVIEEPFRPSAARKSHEILKGVDWANVPELQGYVATTLKPLAEVLLVSRHEDPVLAEWHSGLGRVVAFTSDANGRWGQQWLAWKDFNKFFGQLVRWSLRTRPEDIVSHLSFDGNQGKLSLDVSDNGGNYVNLLEGDAGIVYPDKSRTVIPLVQSAPGRYAATFPANQRGIYLTGVSLKTGDQEPVGSMLGTGVIPDSIEYKVLSLNMPTLSRFADISDGRVISRPEEVFRVEGTSTRRTELWPWLLVLALLSMVGDLILRWAKNWTLRSRPK